MNKAVIGYPYTRPNYRAVFESPDTYFILPKVWKIKKGKAEYHTQDSSHIITIAALFSHSDYPVIGGLLKGWMPAFPWLLWKLKRKHQIQLVFEAHEPTLLTTLYHGITTKALGLQHVVFSWENISFEKKFTGVKGFIHRLILSANLFLSDGVVCGNQKSLDIFKTITKKPLARIPLAGLDPEKFSPPAVLPEHDGVTFIFAGAIDYRKGLHVLLPAFRRLLEEIPGARLIIVGSGTYEEEIKAKIAELDIPVTVHPWLDHPRLIELFSQSDVFVYPSIPHAGWEEQFGYSIAEASLMELPVIATHSGSIDEVVKDGETGILVVPGDVGQLADAMLSLASNKPRRVAYGRAGREFIMRTFRNELIARQYEAFFHSLNR